MTTASEPQPPLPGVIDDIMAEVPDSGWRGLLIELSDIKEEYDAFKDDLLDSGGSDEAAAVMMRNKWDDVAQMLTAAFPLRGKEPWQIKCLQHLYGIH